MPLNPRIASFAGQHVWLVGASTGIGAALAEQLLERGARVAVSARSADKLEARFGRRARVLPLDVADGDTVAGAAHALEVEWGGIDLVVALAGTYKAARAWKLEANEARRTIEVNLIGALNVIAAVQPGMLARGAGRIALVASVAGYGGLPNSLVYGATKAALINLAQTLWMDLAPRGVAVHLVCPGFVETPLTAQNEFKMPALIKPEDAARELLAGLARGEFETHFPKRFTRAMKLLNLLPYRLYFPLVRRMTGL